MLLATLVLITINGEHDSLKKGIDLCHCHKSAEVCDVSGLRLEEKQQISVFLRFLVIREETFL